MDKGLLEKLYENIANSNPKPDLVRFHGVEYKTGSKELQEAINQWRTENNIKHG